MSIVNRRSSSVVLAACATSGALAQFQEPGAVALHAFTGVGGFGWAASELGDITGDGRMEAMISATNSLGGYIDVYDGATGVLLRQLRGVDQGVVAFGWALADAGDVDGDTAPDIVGGAPNSGAVLIYCGADFSLLRRVNQQVAGERLGYAVAGVGDLNGDGYDDVVVGSYTANNGGSNAGRVQVLSGLDGSIIRTITNTVSGQQFGFDALGIGDVSGDGLIDFLVAAGGGNAGYVVRGELACLADVNVDGVASPADFTAWIAAFNAGSHRADQNGDEAVTPADFTAWIANFNNVGC